MMARAQGARYADYWRTFRRTAVAAVLVLALAAVAFLAPLADAAPSTSAQVQPPGPIIVNSANAHATVARLVPTVGGLAVGIDVGSASASLANQVAQGQAATVNAGLLPVLFTAGECPELEGFSSLADQVAPTRADNREGDAHAVNNRGLPADSLVTVGHEEATARVDPPAATATAVSGATIPSLLNLDAGRAEATTDVLENGSHHAVASSEASVTIPGVAQLQGMVWRAEYRIGGGGRASFSLGSVTALGVPVPSGDHGAAEATLNQLLAPLGVTFDFPTVEETNGDVPGVAVSPIRITYRTVPGIAGLVGPVLDPLGAVTGPVGDLVRELSCALAPAFLAGDIVLTIARGNGSIAMEIGGASASAGSQEFENPFGAVPPSLAPSPSPAVDAPSANPAPAAPVVAAPSAGGSAASPPAASAPSSPTAAAVNMRSTCETVHPIGRPACSRGAGAVVGSIGLAAVLGMAFLDLRRQRRHLAVEGRAT